MHSILSLAFALTVASLGPRPLGEDAAALTKQLESRDEAKVSAALEGLSKLGADGTDGLLKATKHEASWVRATAWTRLGESKAAAALEPACAFLAGIPDDGYVSTSEAGLAFGMQHGLSQALVRGKPYPPSKKGPEEDAKVEAIVERCAVAGAVISIGGADPSALHAILAQRTAPVEHGYPLLGMVATFAIASEKKTRSANLLACLEHPSAHVQSIGLLGADDAKDRKPEIADRIVVLLDSPDVGVRGLAWEAVMAVDPTHAAANAKVAAALTDESAFVRVLLARGLTRNGGRGELALPILLACMKDASAFVRAAAIHTYATELTDKFKNLGKKEADAGFRPKSLIAPLTKALADPDADVRRCAAGVLGEFGPEAKSALPALRKAAKDATERSRDAAERAIREIEKDRK